MAPHHGVVAPPGACASANWPISASTPSCVRATTSSPELPASRRCTMPGRIGSPTPASSGKRASSPLTSVPVGLPAPGWTTRPAGLSTTITSSSSWTTPNSTVGSAVGSVGARDGARVDLDHRALGRGAPCPTAATRRRRARRRRRSRAAAAERLMSASSATMRSSRSPSSAAGTRSVIMARRGAAGPLGSDDSDGGVVSDGSGRRRRSAVTQRAQEQQRAADRDADVGDVEDRPPLHVDEVDDAAVEPAGDAEQAVDDVADRAADDQADGRRVQRARSARPIETSRPTTTSRASDTDDRARARCPARTPCRC